MVLPRLDAQIVLKGSDGETIFTPTADGRIAVFRNGRLDGAMPSVDVPEKVAAWLRGQMELRVSANQTAGA